MRKSFEKAAALLRGFKGSTFVSGTGVLPQAGALCSTLGKRAVLVRETFPGSDSFVDSILGSLIGAGVEVVPVVSERSESNQSKGWPRRGNWKFEA